mgnify:CR=1 FL=1
MHNYNVSSKKKKGVEMRATVTLDKEMLDELVKETGVKSAASAVREAISEYLKQRKIEKIKAMKGKLKFDKTAEDLRHYER